MSIYQVALFVLRFFLHCLEIALQIDLTQQMFEAFTSAVKTSCFIDVLTKASRVVAEKIEGGWKTMYRELPFYPARGQHTIDTDLSHILQDNYRSNEVNHCLIDNLRA